MLSPSQKRAHLAHQELFRNLSERELDDLVQAVNVKRVAAREELCHKDDPGNQLYVIVEGLLKAQTSSAAGDDVVFSIMGPGEMFGELALFCGGKRTATVVAIQDSLLLLIDRRELFPFLRRHPDAAIKLLEVLALRVQNLTTRMEDTTFLNLPPRLGKRLLELAERSAQVEHLPCDGDPPPVRGPYPSDLPKTLPGLVAWYDASSSVKQRNGRVWS